MTAFDMLSEDRAGLITKLKERGWLPADQDEFDNHTLKDAVSEFQKWFELKDDGWAGPQTKRVLTGMRFCGLPDKMDLGARLRKWNQTHLKWAVTGPNGEHLPNVDPDEVMQNYEQSYQQWSDHSSLTFEYASTLQDANIVSASGWIDRAGGTLAWSELPPANPVRQKYDTAEPWTTKPPRGGHEIYLLAVACHEIGHALGIEHAPGQGSLMSAYYDGTIFAPQAWDIAEIKKRYPPTSDPAPDPGQPPTGGEARAVVTIDGVRYSGRLRRQ